MNWRKKYSELILSPRIWLLVFLGFSSGLPFALTSSTLQAWLSNLHLSIKEIGIFSLVGLPYVWKFAWSPLMDRFIPPLLGRRRGWMLVTQVGLIIAISVMAFVNPKLNPWLLGFMAFIVVFVSASQDISIDAYRTDLLKPEERGFGSAVFIGGWRLGALISGGIALIVAQYLGFRSTYLIMAAFVLVGLITTLLSPDPAFEKSPPKTLYSAIVEPFKEFISRPFAIWLLIFIVSYKIGDAFVLSLATAFFHGAIGFDLVTIGSVFKIFGVFAVLGGTIVGGLLIPRLGMFRSLLFFGSLQAVSNLMFMWLAVVGKSYVILVATVATENFCGGLATAVFLAFLMGLCNHHYTATQFALLSSLSAVGRVLVGPPAGFMAADMGWAHFYFLSFLFCLPGLILLIWLRKRVDFEGAQIR